MLSLLQLPPEEAEAVPLLAILAAAHNGVTILTPHYPDEPWRAEIREGTVPGESRHTSGMLIGDPGHPAELLRKLEKLFSGHDPEDEPG